jgi:alcohol dehydrogenase
MPKTSLTAVFHGKDHPLSLESVPIPPLNPGEILVRNEYTTLCRSDLNTFSGKRTEPTPTILGHETVGTIEELGPQTPANDARGNPLQPGNRITWAIYASNPSSNLARLGIPQKAPDLFKYGHERITPQSHLHGGLSQYCILRPNTPIVQLPHPIPLPVLALINCSIATVAGSIRLAGNLQNRVVIIAGAGMLGLVACAMAKTAGAKHILALDVNPQRLHTASSFGANTTLNCLHATTPLPKLIQDHLPPGTSAHIALEYSGIPETMEGTIQSLGIGGTIVLVGATYPQRPIQINAEQIVRQLTTIRGLHNYNLTDLLTAVDFIENHHLAFPFSSLIPQQFHLQESQQAFLHGLSSNAHRVGVQC